MKSRTAIVEDLRMRWLESGQGTPVVFLHGIPTSPELWRHVIPRVTSGRCLAWEMIGYGNSMLEAGRRDISVAGQADYLIRWLDHLGIDNAVFVGHDLGAGVAQIAAARHPQRFRGLLITNGIGYDSWPPPTLKVMRAARGFVRHLPQPLFRVIFSGFIHRGHDNRASGRDAVPVHWHHYEAQGGAASFARQLGALDVRDTLRISDQLPRMNIPARIVWGVADPFQKIQYGERFARDLQAPLRRIERGKHFTPEDHPDIIAEEIEALMREIQ